MSTPRKFTWEKGREQAIEVLRRHEAGETPKQIAESFDRDTTWVWAKIQLARRTLKTQAVDEARATLRRYGVGEEAVG